MTFGQFLLIIWAYNWKIFFNPDPSKLARKSAIFKKKENSSSSYHKPQQYSG